MKRMFKGVFRGLFIIVFAVGSTEATDCPDLWTAFGGACYLFGHGPSASFVESEHYCRQHNGHLVELHSSAENLFVKDVLRTMKGGCYWNGLTDEVEGLWKWYSSQMTPTVTDWNPNEPNSGGGDEDCVVFWQPYDYKWGDIDCKYNCFPVCKLDATSEVVGR